MKGKRELFWWMKTDSVYNDILKQLCRQSRSEDSSHSTVQFKSQTDCGCRRGLCGRASDIMSHSETQWDTESQQHVGTLWNTLSLWAKKGTLAWAPWHWSPHGSWILHKALSGAETETSAPLHTQQLTPYSGGVTVPPVSAGNESTSKSTCN